MARSIFLADTTQEARRRARTNSLGRNYEYIGRLFDKGLGRRIYKRDPGHERRRLQSRLPDGASRSSPATSTKCCGGCCALIEETGPFGTLVLMGYDWDDKASWLHSMELFAHELMPALNKALGPVAV